jgi:dTDP-4-dehydrorhamnose reductase
MRWAVTGSGGQLGRCLIELLSANGAEELVADFAHRDLDIADPHAVDALFDGLEGGPPDVLVNAAAFTAVDRCESEEAEAHRVNARAPGLLAERCRRDGVGFAHVSTDYVFNGLASEPYPETAPVEPCTAYGRTKAEGERRVLEVLPDALVVRTSWVFGPGHNFVAAILRQARLRRSGELEGPLRVVDDQLGSPTYALDLAEGICSLARLAREGRPGEAQDKLQGIFHLSGAGVVTWCGFARAILARSGYNDLVVEPIKSDELDVPAKRPLYSVLDCSRAAHFGVRLRGWEEALDAHLASPSGAQLLANGAG